MATMAFIDLLRHGDTGQGGFRGQIDDALTSLGWAQMRAAAAQGQWDAIVSSPLQRCAAFARELAVQRGIPLRLDARLMEYGFGAWQGADVAQLAAEQGEALAAFWSDPEHHPPPEAEEFTVFRKRLADALDEVVHGIAAQRVLVVTHGGPIRLLRCQADNIDASGMANVDVPHASLHRLPWPLPMAGDAQPAGVLP